MNRLAWRNAATFGPGTLGRDMVYFLVATYMVYFITEVVRPGPMAVGWLTAMMVTIRLFDSLLDFVMGTIVERTHTRWGQYKPWIAVGGVASAIATVMLFTDIPHLEGVAFILSFGITFLLWGIAWSMNDIPYWSLLPALTVSPREREVIGAVAKVFGTLGLFSVAVGTLPSAASLTEKTGDPRDSWMILAAIVSGLLVVFQLITLFGVRQPPGLSPVQHTRLRDIVGVLRQNDQLMWTAFSMILYMTGFQAMATLGPYYFKYVYHDETAYPFFAAALGVAQLVGYVTYPALGRRLSRMRVLAVACGLEFVGFLAFFFAPHVFAYVVACGFVIFLGQAYIVMLLIVLLGDTIEYGHWKFGTRHGALTFALQPFIYKSSLALATGVAGVATLVTGIAGARSPAELDAADLRHFNLIMFILPLGLMLIGFFLFRRKWIIDSDLHDRMIADLKQRGELPEEA